MRRWSRRQATYGVRQFARVLGACIVASAAGPGCWEDSPGTPELLGVAPDRGSDDAPVPVVISGNNFLVRPVADFDDPARTGVRTRYAARLGAVPLRDVNLNEDGTLAAVVPEGLEPGEYELTVIDPWDRKASLPRAYRVIAADDTPGLVSTFRFDPIGAQVAFAAFPVTVVAVDGQGSAVAGFNGAATLTDRTTTAVPKSLGYFSAGRWTGAVEIRQALAANALTVSVSSGASGTSGDFAVKWPDPASLAFVTPELTARAGECSPVVLLSLRDASGFAVAVTAPVVVAMVADPAAGVSIYPDATCAAPVTAVTIAADSGVAGFHFRGTKAGRVLLTASATGLRPASQFGTVVPGPPAKLRFATAPQVVNASSCTKVASIVEVADVYDNPVALAAAASLSLTASPATGFDFFADPGCATPLTSVTLPSGAQRTSFYFRGRVAGTVVVQVAAPGFSPAIQDETILPEELPTQLVFTSSPQTLPAGQCSAPAVVETRDTFGNTVPSPGSTQVILTSSPAIGMAFFQDAACTSPASAVLIPANQASTRFYFKGVRPGSYGVTASATALNPATQTEVVVSGPPARLAFSTAPQTIAAGGCSAVATVEVQDAQGNASPVAAATAVNLSAAPATGFAFFTDAGCATAAASATVTPGNASASFWFRGTAAGAVAVTASSAGLAPVSQQEQIGPAPPSQLAFVTSPITVTAGACSGVATVESRDSFGNASAVSAATPVSLSAVPSTAFAFYADAGCTIAASGVTLSAGARTASFFFRGTVPGSVVVTASATGLAPATQTETIRPAAPAHLAFVTPARSSAAGTCSAVLTVESRDSFGNASPVGPAAAVALNAAPPAGFAFYSDPACATSVSSLTLAAGSSALSFYFRGTAAGTVAVTASATGLSSATQSETVSPAPPDRLAIVTPAQTLAAGVCSAVATVESRDPFGNASSVSAATTVAFAAAPPAGFAFYADATCTTAATSATLLAGSSRTSFYFRGTAVGGVAITASPAGFTAASQTETITPAPPSALAFASAAQTLVAGACSAQATVQARDGYGNPSNVGSATPVTLTTSSPGGTFYSDAACATAITGVVIAAGANAASFYFKDTRAGGPILNTSATGLLSGTQTQTINPAPPSKLVFTTAPQTLTAGTCSGAIGIQTQDSFGNASIVASSTAVSLATTSSAGQFSLAAGCGTAVGSLTLAAGASSATFHYGDTVAGTPALTLSAAGLTGATQTQTVNPAAPARLSITSAAQTVVAGACSAAVTVQSQDAFGNPANVASVTSVTLAAAPPVGFAFYADAGCSAAISGVNIAAGANAASFFFRGTAAGSVSVSVSATGLTGTSQSETVNPAPPARLAFTTAAQSLIAGACSAVTQVQAQDAYGNPSPVGSATPVSLSTTSAGGTFWSGAGCTSAISSATMAAGSNGVSFYFKDTRAGTPVLTAQATGLLAGTQAQTINPAPPVKLAFATAPQTVSAGACSAVVTLQVQDSYDNPSPVASATAVGLSASSATLVLYSGASCSAGTEVTGLTLASGASAASFYFKDPTAGSASVTASAAGLTAASQVETIAFGVPTRLAITTAPQTVTAGNCSGVATVQAQDSFGNPANVSSATAVALGASPATGFAFSSGAGCTGAVTSVTIPVGSNSASFSFRGTVAGAVAVTASASGLTSASQTETISPAPPSKLAFTTPAQTLTAGACSAPLTVQAQDLYGNASPVGAATDVSLTSTSTGGTFYSDSSCTAAITGVTVAPGASSATLYLKDTRAGAPTLTAQATSLTSTTQIEVINPAPPANLAFATAAQTVTAGACSAVVTIQSQDTYGNVSSVAAATAVSLASSSASGAFYSDAACATAIAGVTLAAGASAASFYFNDTRAGGPTLTASATGMTSGTQVQTVNPAPPSKLAFTTPAQTLTAGACSGVATVQSQDVYGNASPVGAATPVSLSSSSAGGTFFSDALCSAQVTGVTVAAGASSAIFYFRDTRAGTPTLTAQATGLTSATQTETINPASPSKLAFATAAQSLTAGACSAAATIESQDTYGNVSAMAAATAVALAASPSTGFAFYSDAGCTAAVTGATLPAGGSAASYFFKGTAAGSVTVTASASGLTGATQVEAINPAAPTRLAFTTAAQTLTAGACSAVTAVQTQDGYGNASPVGAATPLSLSTTSSGGTFYSDPGCATAITVVTIAAGTNAASFYFKDTRAGTPALTASATGLTSVTQSETINPAPPSKLTFTSAAQTLTTGACSAVVTVESRDAYDNPSSVATATAVSLSTTSSGGTFYSDAGCATAVTGANIAAGTNSASFYFKDTQAGTPTLTATASGLTSATQTQTLSPAPPSKLAFATPAQTVSAGSCSAVLTVQSQDPFGNPSNVGAATAISLSTTSAGGTFYSDAACATSVTGVTLAAGASSASFYFKDTVAGGPTVTASATGLTPATQTETINPAPPAKLAFITPAQTLTAGSCSAVATVESRDPYDNPSNVATATAVSLSTTSSGGTFYSDSACATAVTSATIAAGASSASFYFKDTQAGTPTLTASASGLTPATQTATVNPGPTSVFAWDSISSPKTQDVAFAVTVRARDAYGNATPSFTGTATLSITPTGTVSCTTSCTNSSTTGAFVSGVWTGSVSVGAPTGLGRQLTATSGAITGTSNAFDVVSQGGGSPPLAKISYNPAVIVAGQSVDFNAAPSTDAETASAGLEVSWDFSGVAAGDPPWTAWTTVKTASNSYSTAGTYEPRLAVRDSDGNIGYASVRVVALATATGLCRVDTAALSDDGASSCAGPFGTDGKLSLDEALRLSNPTAARETITFSGAMTLVGTSARSVTGPVDIVAPTGVKLQGVLLSAGSGDVLISGIEMYATSTMAMSVGPTATLTLMDSHVHDFQKISVSGAIRLIRARIRACSQQCVDIGSAGASVTSRYSEFLDAAGANAIYGDTCSGNWADIQSTVFAKVKKGVNILSTCNGSTVIRNNTFSQVNRSVEYNAGTNHVLRNNIFDNNSVDSVWCAAGLTFDSRDRHLRYTNNADSCILGDPDTLTSSPQFVYTGGVNAADNDYRIKYASPARDTALDLGLDLNDSGPGNFFGAGPDRGGRETW